MTPPKVKAMISRLLAGGSCTRASDTKTTVLQFIATLGLLGTVAGYIVSRLLVATELATVTDLRLVRSSLRT